MLENVIEKYLVDRVESLGGICYKFASPGRRGVPDRIAILPGGRVIFIECKKPKGGRHSECQKIVIGKMRTLGADVRTVSTKEQVDEIN